MEKRSRYLSQSKQSQVFAVLKSAGVSNSDSWKLLLTSSKDGALDDSLNKQQRNQFEGLLVLYVCLLFYILWGAIFYPNSLFLYCKFIWKLILAKLEWHICVQHVCGKSLYHCCCIIWKQIAALNILQPVLCRNSCYKRQFKLIVPSDFRGLWAPCFWQNFVFESNIVKETLSRLMISIFHIKHGA